MRKKLIVANWKMHNTVHQASLLVHHLAEKIDIHRDVEVVLCPTMLALQSVSLQVNRRQFKLGAQNCHWRDEGAFTGEVAAAHLRGVVEYVLVGHSERRHVFMESERDIRAKVQAVIRNQMKPILCIGETAQERVDGETKHVIHDQLLSGLANLTSEEITEVTIAYEPVWAIGTGENAQPRDVEKVAELIRKQIAALYGDEAAEAVRVLYGGSVNENDVSHYLDAKDIDGVLVGGASLSSVRFAKIVEMAHTKH